MFPVDRVGVGTLDDIVNPCAVRRVSVGTNLDQVDRTQQAITDDLFRLLVAVSLASLVSELEDYARFLDHLPDHIGLGHCPGERFLAVDMLSGAGGVHGHRAVPMVRAGDDDRVDIRGGQKLLVCTVALGRRAELAVAALAIDVGARQLGSLPVNIKDIADPVDDDIQVVLLEVLLVTVVFLVLAVRLFHLVDPRGLGESGRAHQLFATDTEADDTQTDLLAIFLGLQEYGLLVADLEDIRYVS